MDIGCDGSISDTENSSWLWSKWTNFATSSAFPWTQRSSRHRIQLRDAPQVWPGPSKNMQLEQPSALALPFRPGLPGLQHLRGILLEKILERSTRSWTEVILLWRTRRLLGRSKESVCDLKGVYHTYVYQDPHDAKQGRRIWMSSEFGRLPSGND